MMPLTPLAPRLPATPTWASTRPSPTLHQRPTSTASSMCLLFTPVPVGRSILVLGVAVAATTTTTAQQQLELRVEALRAFPAAGGHLVVLERAGALPAGACKIDLCPCAFYRRQSCLCAT